MVEYLVSISTKQYNYNSGIAKRRKRYAGRDVDQMGEQNMEKYGSKGRNMTDN